MLDVMQRGTVPIEDLEVGLARSLQKTVSDKDIELFGAVSTDRNPVHFCDEYAGETLFKGRVAHGMLTAALFSAVIGEQLPGHGSIYLEQTLKFVRPVRPGDTVTATVTVMEIDHRHRRVTLDCVATVGEKAVLRGQAVVLAPSRALD
ncbi:MAG: MaoC family dehydratase [Pseudomonadota bacterium]